MSHYDLHPNIHQSSWDLLVYNPITLMHTLTERNVSKVEGRKLGLTTVNSGVVVEEASRKGGGRGFELR
jgi:hypothetical protein